MSLEHTGSTAHTIHNVRSTLHIPLVLVELLHSDWHAAAVYCFLAQRAVRESQPVVMSTLDIAVEVFMSESRVAKAVKKLVEQRLLSVERKQSPEHGYAPTNHYYCHFLEEARQIDGLMG